MKYKCLLVAVIVVAAIPSMVMAQDFNGTWKGIIIGKNGLHIVASFEFVVTGTKLTGSVIDGRDEFPFFDTKVKGDKIAFVIRRYAGDRYTPYVYTGKMVGDTIKFTITWGINSSLDFIAGRADTQSKQLPPGNRGFVPGGRGFPPGRR